MKDQFPLTTASTDLTEQLKTKNRQRRKGLAAAGGSALSSRVARNDVLPGLSYQLVPIVELSPPANKTRKLNSSHVMEVADSIKVLGFCAPILIGKGKVVIDGQIRLEAARLLGMASIPCITVEHLTEPEQRVLRLALNRLGEKGEWDLDELKLEFGSLLEIDIPIEIAGFSADVIDHILLEDDQTSVEVGPCSPEPNVNAVARIGDVFLLGDHCLICGDARDPRVLQILMEGAGLETARYIFTDVPYNVRISGHVSSGEHREFSMASGEMTDEEFLAFNKAWMAAALPYLADGGILATFIDWRGIPIVHSAALAHNLKQLNLAVWAKTNAGMGSLYRSQHELLPIYKKGIAPHLNNVNLGSRGRHRSNLWTYPGASSMGSDARRGLQDHPTVKPTRMLEDALLDLTNRGDIVIDPFLGSGSTLIAAHNSGRICCGIELDPLYVDVIVRRFEKTTSEMVVLEETGENFHEVTLRRNNIP